MKKYFVLLIVISLFGSFKTPKTKILIIGDSISIGYTPFIEKALKDKAIVKHNKGNAGHTGMGIEHLGDWIGDSSWDIILFNWGLWDLCYRHPDSKVQGNRDKLNGTITFPVEEYEKNLIQLVKKLKETHSELIFVTTSYVPKDEAGRFKGDEKKYNKVAKKVMRENEIQIKNIYPASKRIHKKHGKGTDDVHYTTEGYELLAKEVLKFLKNEL